MKRKTTRFAAVAAAMLLAACGGGGGGGMTVPPAAPATPSQSGSSSVRVTLTSNAETVALAGAGTFNPVLDVHDGDAPVGGTLTVSTTLDAPADAPQLASSTRKALQTGHVRVLFYETIVADRTVTLRHLPATHVDVIDAEPNELFSYAISDPTRADVQAAFRTEGPAEFSGHTARFARTLDPFTFVGGKRYVVAFYGVQSGDQLLATWSYTLVGAARVGTSTARLKAQATPFGGVSAGKCLIEIVQCNYWLVEVLRLDAEYSYTTQLRDATTFGFAQVASALATPGSLFIACFGVPSDETGCSFVAFPAAPVDTVFFPHGGSFAGKTVTTIVTNFGKVIFAPDATASSTNISIPLTVRVFGH